MKVDKELIAFISGLIMMVVGVVLNIIASFKEFGVWSFLSRPSIAETKLLFVNQAEYIVPGFILVIVGYIIVSIVSNK